MGDALRLFVAVDLDPNVRARVSTFANDVRALADRAHWKASWTRDENLHVTVQFLGAVETERVAQIVDAIQSVAARHRAFGSGVGHLGAFRDRNEPRVLFLEIDRGLDAFRALARDLADTLAPLGFAPEHRAFHPHVTIARVRRAPRRAQLSDVTPHDAPPEHGATDVTHLTLYRSDPGERGSVYSVVARAPLQRADVG